MQTATAMSLVPVHFRITFRIVLLVFLAMSLMDPQGRNQRCPKSLKVMRSSHPHDQSIRRRSHEIKHA